MKLTKIKATINREVFLNKATKIPNNSTVSLTASKDNLLISSLTMGINCNIPAKFEEFGHYFLSGEEWQKLFIHVQNQTNQEVEIDLSDLV